MGDCGTLKTFGDFLETYIGNTSVPKIEKKETCSLCKKMKEYMVDHHVYLYDDGNGKVAKYSQWTIRICGSCNQNISYLNRLIRQFLIQDIPIKNRMVSSNYSSNKDILKLCDAIFPLDMGLTSHHFRSNRARTIWNLINYLKEYDSNNRGDLYG